MQHVGLGQILEAAGAGKGRVLEGGLVCVRVWRAWCSLCVRKLCFRGARSVRAGSEAEQRAG